MSTESAPKMLRPTFDLNANERDQKSVIYPAIDKLMQSLSEYETIQDIRPYYAQEHIQECFESFLEECGFKKALSSFQILIAESEGSVRSSGMPSWYHQFVPILTALSFVRDGTISLEALQEDGGLECFIRTYIDHDRFEDVAISAQRLGKDLYRAPDNADLLSKDEEQIEAIKTIAVYQSVMLLSKQRVAFKDGEPQYDSDGKLKKIKLFKNDKEYMRNMLDHPHAIAGVWFSKLLDGCENQAFLDVPKFTTQKRLKKCLDLTDMFASPGFSDEAMEKWPEFADAIDKIDSLMGGLVFLNLRELAFVDGIEVPFDVPTIEAYLDDIVSIKVPRAFHMFYQWLDTKHEKARYHNDEPTRVRTLAFLQQDVYPDLETKAAYFPSIFTAEEAALQR